MLLLSAPLTVLIINFIHYVTLPINVSTLINPRFVRPLTPAAPFAEIRVAQRHLRIQLWSSAYSFSNEYFASSNVAGISARLDGVTICKRCTMNEPAIAKLGRLPTSLVRAKTFVRDIWYTHNYARTNSTELP